MKSIIQLIRPKEWIKNLFLFAPIFFGGAIFNSEKLLFCSLGFVCFSIAASSIYILNDLRDLTFDRQHPKKKERPIASGKVKEQTAWLLMFVLMFSALAFSLMLKVEFGLIIVCYLILNFAYSFFLKHIAIIDITCIASGFLLRVLAGGVLSGIVLSPWLLIMTFLVSLFLGFGKRRDDVLLLNESGTKMRKSVDGYNLEFINAAMVAMASVLIVCYINYITSAEVSARITHPYFFVSAFFVTIAMLRYLQIAIVEKKSGSPTKVVTSDAIIITMIISWAIHFAISIYL